MKKILVIEDWIQEQNFFLTHLQTEGFNTIIAKNSLINVQIVQNPLPNLIICNLSKLDSNSYGIMTRLRQDPVVGTISFTFVVDSETRTDYRKIMELGANDYLVQPLTQKELMETITTQLKKQEALQQGTTRCQQISETAPANKVKAPKFTGESVFLLKKIFEFIEANFHQSITLDSVAQAVSYSPAYLTKLVRHQTGKSLYSWIIEYRMAAARSLLLETEKPVNHIAIELGYKDACHFSRQFRQFHKTTPLAWRSKRECYIQ
ncbi:MAG: helix-turn-helix domain-containing protein [Nostoc sp.]|uniref:helix-turn-helix domain-containing protein n=1 Tax=Nostoc sp. TaxID=1180 RepID=UPI002FF1E91D